jgi:hypothetical protein
MKMIGHPTVGVQARLESGELLGYDVVQRDPIGCVAEQGLAVIATENDVEVSARDV